MKASLFFLLLFVTPQLFAQSGTLTFSGDSFFTDEDAGEFAISIERRNGTQGTLIVAVTTPIIFSGAGADDFTEVNTLLTFPDGSDEAQTILITIHEDTQAEADEVFEVALQTQVVRIRRIVNSFH